MNPFTPPNRDRFGPIHTREGLRDARRLHLAAMDKWCEVIAPGEESPGGGEPDTPPIRKGRLRCGIALGTRGSERDRPDQMAASEFEWEFVLPLGSSVNARDRLAWPCFLNLWKPGANRIENNLIAPSGWVSGSAPILRCVRSGISANGEPDWPDVLDQIVEDGGAAWQLIGWATLFEVLGVVTAQSQPTALIVRAKEQG